MTGEFPPEPSASVPLAHKLERFSLPRVDLMPIIRHILTGRFAPVVSDEFLLKNETGERYETAEIWRSLKPERNALLSLMIEEIWDSFDNWRQLVLTSGLEKKNLDRDKPLDADSLKVYSESITNLMLHATAVFSEGIDRWVEDKKDILNKDPQEMTRAEHAYYRLQLMLAYGHDHEYSKEKLEDLIKNGLGTASRSIFGLMEVAPQLLQQAGFPVTLSNIRQVVIDNYGPFILRFATAHQAAVVPILQYLVLDEEKEKGFKYDSQKLILEKRGNRLVINIDQTVLDEVVNSQQMKIYSKLFKIFSPITWCPAIFRSKGKEGIIRAYFNWALAMADKTIFKAETESTEPNN